MSEQKCIRIGTIGSGNITEKILSSIDQTEGIRCTAVYSRSAEKGRALADRHGIPTVYTDLEAFLSCPDFSFVYIASPNALHARQARAAFLAGKHVLLEKPMTVTGREAEELAALAREKGLLLYEMMVPLHLPNFRLLKDQLPALGRIRAVMMNYSQYSSRYDQLLEGTLTNIFDPALGGGALMDIGIYNVSLCIALFGEPCKASYYSNRCPLPGNPSVTVDTSGIVLLQYPDFAASLTGAKDTWGENYVLIEGEKGYLYIPGGSAGLSELQVHKRTTAVSRNDVFSGSAGSREEFCVLNDQNASDRWLLEIQSLAKILSEDPSAEELARCYKRLDTTVSVMKTIDLLR